MKPNLLAAYVLLGFFISNPALAALTWVSSSGGSSVSNAIVGGSENSKNLMICRASYSNATHPGKVVGTTCNIGWGDKEVSNTSYEVLTGLATDVRWFTSNNGEIIPLRIAGGVEGGNTLWICRFKHGDGVHSGKQVGKTCNIGFGGKEVKSSVYEVLIEGKATSTPASTATPAKAEYSEAEITGMSLSAMHDLKSKLTTMSLKEFKYFTTYQLKNFTKEWGYVFQDPVKVKEVTTTMVGYMGYDALSVDLLNLMSKEQIQAIQDVSLTNKNITVGNFYKLLADETLKKFSDAQVKIIPGPHDYPISKLRALYGGRFNLIGNRFEVMDTGVVGSLTTDEIKSLSADSFGNLNSRIFNAFTLDQVKAITLDQIKKLSISQGLGRYEAVSTKLVQAFTTDQLNAMSVSAINFLAGDPVAWSSEQLKVIKARNLTGLNANIVNAMSFDFAKLTVDAIKLLTDAQVGSFTEAQVKSLTKAQMAGFSFRQLCGGLGSKRIALLTTEQLQGLTSAASAELIYKLTNFSGGCS